MDAINGKGGVGGRKINVKTEDDESKQDEAVTAVQKLISQNTTGRSWGFFGEPGVEIRRSRPGLEIEIGR